MNQFGVKILSDSYLFFIYIFGRVICLSFVIFLSYPFIYCLLCSESFYSLLLSIKNCIQKLPSRIRPIFSSGSRLVYRVLDILF